ncbi:unnamed protein product [Thlaspi arvense]|uniref:Uncharacterized protein n=1 Tax=Thlaspi arvense TaxID=13288 RepID=A0AAU9T547_THLAR|nr:unnamed protein product [Thlaspi arvense]
MSFKIVHPNRDSSWDFLQIGNPLSKSRFQLKSQAAHVSPLHAASEKLIVIAAGISFKLIGQNLPIWLTRLSFFAVYVDLATVAGFIWWFVYSDGGPKLSYSELVSFNPAKLVLTPRSNLWLVGSIIMTMVLHILISYVHPLAVLFSVSFRSSEILVQKLT